MRPFRSFLLLLIFLVCLTGFFNIYPVNKLISGPSKLEIADTVTITDTTEPSVEVTIKDPLASFIDSLRESKGQVRIMYYGDSQVEGDRITFYLRQLLREERGGTGPGLFLPVMPVMYTKSVWLRSSPDWKRYNYLSYKSGEISHHSLGPFMAICRYLPEGVTTTVPEKAFIRIRPSIYADSAASYYDQLRIFYSHRKGEVNITVKADDNQVLADTLISGTGIMERVCSIKGAQEVLIEFEGNVSPDIYGISIESKNGVIVDNIPQRGSAGLEFTMVDRDKLREIYKMLSPDLIILHYGLNIVKNVRNDYSYYKRGLSRQLSALKEMAPFTSVLVIGVTDMALNEGDSVKSYTNIPVIVKAQKEAALEAGAAFWDSYSAMGGSQSIVKWAEKKPPLAQNDYVHFTYPGADTLSQMLNKALFPAKVKDTIPVIIHSLETDSVISTSTIPGNITQNKVPERSLAGSVISQIFSYDPDKPFIFTAPAFWLFFLFVLAGYSLIYRKLFLRNFFLLVVSLFFYYKTGGLFLFLLIFVTVIDFTCGFLIYRSQRKFFRKLFILFSLLSNLGILAYFKYTGFLVSTINDLAGTNFQVYDILASFSNAHLGTSFDISNIILPAGISFFTFQSLSYTLDIYRRKLEPVKNIFDFGFYVSFFPQLVAGPIVRASEFIPQLYADFSLTKREFSHALFMVSKGLIKKIVISDFIAVNFVDRVFDLPSMYSGFENLMAVYGYGLQIYCDFSGYTDIAIGLALILGFRLPINFNSPYKAAGISDFWKRWHISLSRWLKDYLYISLGGNRKGKFRTGINLMITMLLGGLWHGASIRFVIWGGLHGIGLIINKIWNSLFGERLKSRRLGRIFAVFITFNFVSFCWIFFRSPDIHSATIMLKQIGENFSPGSYMTVLPAYSSVFLLMAAGYLIHFLPEKVKESYRGLFIRMPLIAQLVIVVLVAILLLQMRTTDIMPFIYFRF
jgi:D-alanyl-lipoteichoic acid acyltransferase DltB (MBOAT superfamily)